MDWELAGQALYDNEGNVVFLMGPVREGSHCVNHGVENMLGRLACVGSYDSLQAVVAEHLSFIVVGFPNSICSHKHNLAGVGQLHVVLVKLPFLHNTQRNIFTPQFREGIC